MAIWSAEIKELQNLHESLKGQVPDLEKELDRLVKAEDDIVILLCSRRCLEVIITNLCERELKRPRKTEPLKGIIDKLNKEEKVPSHIITSMQNLNSLSAYGAHPKEFDPEQVKPVLNNLATIIKWYLKYKNVDYKLKAEEPESERPEEVFAISNKGLDIPKAHEIEGKTNILSTPQPTNKLTQFWQELKRRKVVRVITLYAAVAFVIIELINNIAEPLQLPEWTLTLVIVLLAIGFPIAIIFSWIFDVTPEGVKKTKPIKEVQQQEPVKPTGSTAWKIATYISVVIIAALVVFNIVSSRKQAEDITELEKSIAVLPFRSLSDDPEKQYLADGVMDAILLHLSKIEDLRVMARTSVEQYRETNKTVSVIGQELDVAYLLKGSFQKYGDNARLIVQLIKPGKEGHVWANEYDRNWNDIFSVQSEVAQTIARGLHAIITPEEKQLIEKTPTTNLSAYDFYQRGVEELWKYWLNADREALERAEDLYYKALGYDSTFAQVYEKLAWVYYAKHYWEDFFSDDFLDSVLILADIALSYDDQLAEAYDVKGQYYSEFGKRDQAIKEYDKAIKLNPNDWWAYYSKGRLYLRDDLVKAIDNYQKATSLHRGPWLPISLRSISRAYGHL